MRLLFDEAINGILDSIEPGFLQHAKDYYSWIINNCKGRKVLDFGSYRGIVSLILAKQGIDVTYIVSEPLDAQYVKGNWNPQLFEKIKIYHFEPTTNLDDALQNLENHFDTIILSERGYKIENVLDPLLKRDLLNSDGRLVISQPYGVFGTDVVDDELSHGNELYPLLFYSYSLVKLDLMGGNDEENLYYWICLALDKTNSTVQIEPTLIKLLDEYRYIFIIKDKASYDIIMLLKNKIKEIKLNQEEKNNYLSANIKNMMYALNDIGVQIDRQFPQLINNEYQEELLPLQKDMNSESTQSMGEEMELSPSILASVETTKEQDNLSEQFIIARMKLTETIKILNNELSEEERLLMEYGELKRKYETLESKYNSLTGSKSVKMTLAIWNLFKKKPYKK